MKREEVLGRSRGRYLAPRCQYREVKPRRTSRMWLQGVGAGQQVEMVEAAVG